MGNQNQSHWKLGAGIEYKAQVSHLRCKGARVFIHQLPSVTGWGRLGRGEDLHSSHVWLAMNSSEQVPVLVKALRQREVRPVGRWAEHPSIVWARLPYQALARSFTYLLTLQLVSAPCRKKCPSALLTCILCSVRCLAPSRRSVNHCCVTEWLPATLKDECDYLCVNDGAMEAQRGQGIYIRSRRLH